MSYMMRLRNKEIIEKTNSSEYYFNISSQKNTNDVLHFKHMVIMRFSINEFKKFDTNKIEKIRVLWNNEYSKIDWTIKKTELYQKLIRELNNADFEKYREEYLKKWNNRKYDGF